MFAIRNVSNNSIKFYIFGFCMLYFSLSTIAAASSMEEEFIKQYPVDRFIVGIGQAKITKNRNLDERIATITARALIAQQIRVRIKQTFVATTTCEGATGKLFAKNTECQNSVVSTIEQTVEEVLVGANAVKTGVEGGMVYAVVVLPLAVSAQKLEESIDDALNQAKDSLKSAKKDGGESYIKARDYYLKAKMLSKEKESLDGSRSNAERAFQEMEEELIKLKG